MSMSAAGLTGEVEATKLDCLVHVLRGRRSVVLAGAGCSTESGIPDYRGPDGRMKVRRPIQYQEFVRNEEARLRYWARSTMGWPRVAGARPNAAHEALAGLEESGAVAGIITQNVDGLHQKAGSRRVVELHGALARVRCLTCDGWVRRADFQERLLDANPGFAEWFLHRMESERVVAAPDGDAEIPADLVEEFQVPGCGSCGGMLKPDVVFFGENVPRSSVEAAWELFAEGEVLLVLGSSLTVYSGRRFMYGAEEAGIPIVVVNLGPTRADGIAAAKLDGRLGSVMPSLAAALTRT